MVSYYTKDNYDFSKHSDPVENIIPLTIFKILLGGSSLVIAICFSDNVIANIGWISTLFIFFILDLVEKFSFKSNILSTVIAAALTALIILIITVSGIDLIEYEYKMDGLPLMASILFYLMIFIPIMLEGAIADSIVYLINKKKKQH